jgi:adenine-specific DNA-methyltransferase
MEKRFLQENILAAPYRRDQWIEVLQKVFGAKRINQIPPIVSGITSNKLTDGAWELGSLTTSDDRLIGIFEVKIKPNVWIERNRLGLREILKTIYKNEVDGALIAFDQGEKWRFSFVSEIHVRSELTEDEIEERKTEPKRYTYLFGRGESCRTAADRFIKLQGKPIHITDLFDAFSIEKLNKEFFDTYKANYERFWRFLASKQEYSDILKDKNESEKDKIEKPIRNFTKVLLGRMVFLQFLQKKGWMGVPLSNNSWIGGDPKFIQNLFDRFNDKEHFHSTCLKTLFFETLNTKRGDDLAPRSIVSETQIRIPYLNGGLFDKDVSYYHKIDFPPTYFKELLDFFERYNFTIDENDPYDREMGIDPEMLGHIFENLLEENKEKGTFYTPKEIVHFMCQESLIQYVRIHIPECTDDESPATRAVESFIRTGIVDRLDDPKNFIVKNAKRIEALLDRVKVCDPAIGSGAFPMGMLQVIFKSKMALDLTLDRAAVKKEIIQNTIYGVDVEKGAVDIARLRFWLALVVDEDEPQPLPNLDYKIMQGNSLFESFESIDLMFEPKRFEVKIIKEVDLFGRPINPQISITEYLQSKEQLKEFSLKDLEDKYFNSNNALEKQEIKTKIDAFEKEFIEEQVKKREGELGTLLKAKKGSNEQRKNKEFLLHEQELAELSEVKQMLRELRTDNKPYFLWHLYFMDVFVEGGFDIIIGNPPYLRIQGIRETDPKMADKIVKEFKSATGSFDLYVPFVEQGMKLLKNTGILNYIMPVKWTNSSFGVGLRDLLSQEHFTQKIISFDAYQVFNVSTYTGLQWFRRSSKKLFYNKLDRDIPTNEDLGDFLSSLTSKDFNPISSESLTKEPWTLTDSSRGLLLDKIKADKLTVKDYFEKVFQGIATSKDSVFFINDVKVSSDNRLITGFSKELNKQITIEAGIVRKLLMGDQVHRYETLTTSNYVIIPYKLVNDQAKLYSESEIKSLFPKAYEYLKHNEQTLRERERGRLKNDDYWFRYIYPKNLNLFETEKLVSPDISYGGNFAYDAQGEFYSTTTVYGYLKKDTTKLHYEYFLGILNSKICWFFLTNTGTVLSNGYFRYKSNYINKFPIPEPSHSDEGKIIELVRKVVKNKKLGANTSVFENKLDALAFQIYGLEESDMLQILDGIKDLSIKDRTQIHNEYRNIKFNKFSIES